MSKQHPSLRDILHRFDRLEQRLEPLLESVNQEEDYLSLDKLPFPVGTARKYIYAGLLPALRIGKRLYVKKSDLTAFMEKLHTDSKSQKQRMNVGNRLVGIKHQ